MAEDRLGYCGLTGAGNGGLHRVVSEARGEEAALLYDGPVRSGPSRALFQSLE